MIKFVVLLWLACLPISTPFAAEVVKRSGSGLCHDKNSQWYELTRNYTAYSNMQNCLAAGGKAYSGYTINPQATITEDYNRDLFPHWLDEDGNCRDTRAETLIRQSDVPVAFADAAGCQVTSGRWYDPYTNNTFTDDDDLDIDHIVPLKWAYEHGANKWPENVRAAFANDNLNVIAVSLSANRSKGAKGPTEWMPTEWMPANHGFRCQYLERFQQVIRKYQLSFKAAENRVVSKQLSACALTG